MNTYPGHPAPDLSVSTLDGNTFELSKQEPENFTMVVFYRGLHCPVCKTYLKTLTQLADEYDKRGVKLVAVSMDTESRAREAQTGWELDGFPIGYGLSEADARAWSLFMSDAIKEGEPSRFSEPGLFLVRPDKTLYYAAITSMPFGRPDLEEFVKRIDFILEKDYPARGTA